MVAVSPGGCVVSAVFRKSALAVLSAVALTVGLSAASPVLSQSKPTPVGKIEWGVWVDEDGCMHWWADGGLEGYMVPRRNPHTGKPVCLKKNTCLVEPTDTLFATDSHHLTAAGRKRLESFFRQEGVFGYAIYGHTDSRASHAYNQGLSERRARSVAQVARSVGAVVERQIGFGETQPIATNTTAAGMQKNRRVEVICYRW